MESNYNILVDELREAICKLPTNNRAVLVLTTYGGMSEALAAKILGFTHDQAHEYRQDAIVMLGSSLNDAGYSRQEILDILAEV